MEINIYSLFDNKTEAYGSPMLFTSEIACKAYLTHTLNHPDFEHVNPADAELYFIGKFNNENGQITTKSHPEHICNCRTLKHNSPEKKKAITK